jgi:hypothetical protein
VPQLRPGDLVIWDNLRPHQSPRAVEAIEGPGRGSSRYRRTART